MSAKHFLIAHGEKLAVVAVAGGCALVLWTSLSDETLRPKDDQKAIEDVNAKIGYEFVNQAPPVMKEPRPYLDQLLARVAESVPTSPVSAWLTLPPDVSTGGPGDMYIYVAEVHAPSISIRDNVGTVEIAFELPGKSGATAANSARRISSDPAPRWERNDKGAVVNTARQLGVQFEIKIGDGDWKPLVLPGANAQGVMPITGLPKGPVTIPTPEPWQRHQVRSRLIEAATALDLDAPGERPKASVVVYNGSASAGPTDDAAAIEALVKEIKGKAGEHLAKILRPVDGPLPTGAKLNPGEKVFLGPWSPADDPAAACDTTASVRFALLGFSSEPLKDDPTKTRDVAKFWVLRLFQQGAERKWMAKPVELRYGQGDELGSTDEPVKGPNPFDATKTIIYDLATPFVVDKLIKDQKRVLFWTIKPKARASGGKDRDLELGNKEVNTDIVVLKNPETGSELTLTKLISIAPPGRADTYIYPHRSEAYNEKDDFSKAPSEFRQWGLIPEQPKSHAPGTGPLAELYTKLKAENALDADNHQTDTNYFEMPDGRLIWWDSIEHKVAIHDPNGVMTAKAAPPAAAPEPPKGPHPTPAPKGQPKTPPPGQPSMPPPGSPGGPPPGWVPPPNP